MPKKKPYVRIAITLPSEDLALADRLAARLDRSRSWVIAEAVRNFRVEKALRSPLAVRETTAAYATEHGAGLGQLRLEQLEADLRLTPVQRVRAAEDTAREAQRPRPPTGGDRLLFFDNGEAYLRWKQKEAAIA